MTRSIEQEIRNKSFGSRNGNFEKSAVIKNQGTKQRVHRILGDCWQCEVNGQCSKGDNCSFRHDINKRGKVTQPNPSPSSFIQQNERNASRTWRARGRSSSGRRSRWPCKDYLKGNCTKFIRWIVASSRMFVLQVRKWMQICGKVLIRTSSGWWTAEHKVQKEWWQRCSGYVENYTTNGGLRISKCGAAEVYNDFEDELKYTESNPMCSIHKCRRTSC